MAKDRNEARGKKAAKKQAREAYSVINKLNKEIVKRGGELGIIPDKHTGGKGLKEGSSDAAKTLTQYRNNKILQAIYTLLENNIEAIMAKGIMTALSDSSNVGAQMCRYFIDMYTPDESIKHKWESEDTKSQMTYVQQLLYVKMQLDSKGMSVDDLKNLIDKGGIIDVQSSETIRNIEEQQIHNTEGDSGGDTE